MKTIMQIKPGTSKTLQFDTAELILLVEALNHCAGRLDKGWPRQPQKTAAMRALIKKIAES